MADETDINAEGGPSAQKYDIVLDLLKQNGFIDDDGAAELREFVMSCRVAKKLCEQSVVLFLAERAAAQGAKVFRAAVTPTGRNGALVEAFDAMPFTVREADGRRVYELDLSDTARRRDVVRHPVEATA